MAEGASKRTKREGKRRGAQTSAPTTSMAGVKEEDREALTGVLLEKSQEKNQQKVEGGTKEKKKMEEVNKVKEVPKVNEDSYLQGQKCDILDERDPLRIFLETLYQQLPDDELAVS